MHYGLLLFLSTWGILRACSVYRKRQRLQSGVEPHKLTLTETDVRPWMQIIASVIVLGVACAVILMRHFSAEDKQWAYGAVGSVVGFWLKD